MSRLPLTSAHTAKSGASAPEDEATSVTSTPTATLSAIVRSLPNVISPMLVRYGDTIVVAMLMPNAIAAATVKATCPWVRRSLNDGSEDRVEHAGDDRHGRRRGSGDAHAAHPLGPGCRGHPALEHLQQRRDGHRDELAEPVGEHEHRQQGGGQHRDDGEHGGHVGGEQAGRDDAVALLERLARCAASARRPACRGG